MTIDQIIEEIDELQRMIKTERANFWKTFFKAQLYEEQSSDSIKFKSNQEIQNDKRTRA